MEHREEVRGEPALDSKLGCRVLGGRARRLARAEKRVIVEGLVVATQQSGPKESRMGNGKGRKEETV